LTERERLLHDPWTGVDWSEPRRPSVPTTRWDEWSMLLVIVLGILSPVIVLILVNL
jgi:hypothetical protein